MAASALGRPRPEDVTTFLEHALAGRVKPAVTVALALLDRGVAAETIVEELLAPAQRDVGALWEANRLTIADEHLVTGSCEASLHALAMTGPRRDVSGDVVVACAEGDWHSVGAHMFAVQLEALGVGVRFLGASTPATHVARLLDRHRPDALLVSCTMPTCFSGVTRLVDAAHALDVPVLVGGGALRDGGLECARRLGADAWAPDAVGAVAVVRRWQAHAPTVSRERTKLPEHALDLERRAAELAAAALTDPPDGVAGGDGELSPGQLLTHEDMTLVVRFLASAQMVGCDAVFTAFLGRLSAQLRARGLPDGSLGSALNALVARVPDLTPADVTLLRRGRTSLVPLTHPDPLKPGQPT